MHFNPLTLILPLVSVNIVAAAEKEMKKLNILCIVCEDISPFLGCYGDKLANTPNLDKLAQESIRYTHMYTTVGVSAPSRAALITGMYPTSIGANQMRNYGPEAPQKYFPKGISSYEVVLPDGVKCFTEFLREKGYYCTNNAKTDYQFAPPLTAWDECGKSAHWKNKPVGMPFFSIFNIETTHESQIWKRAGNSLVVNPTDVILPPYFPDDPVVRKDMAILYSNIHEMDKQVQSMIDQIKAAGLLDSTIIIFYSDNGGPMPRGKRAVYESGTLVPFMVRFPDGFRKGEVDQSLVSFVDVAPTLLSLANIKPPRYIQGKAFLGKVYNKSDRKYVFGASDRFDEAIDKIGYIRDCKFRYIKNYMPEMPGYLPIEFRLQMPMMRRMTELLAKDSLNEIQKSWFKSPKVAEEFYNVENDPHEINNLINNPAYKNEISRLRKAYKQWDDQYNHRYPTAWDMTEKQCQEVFWPNNEQPVLCKPVIRKTIKGVEVSSKDKSVSFSYQINAKGYTENTWYLYSGSISLNKNDELTVVAVKAGCKNSCVVSLRMN
jgi:arylsulfatase A-like enzyme